MAAAQVLFPKVVMPSPTFNTFTSGARKIEHSLRNLVWHRSHPFWHDQIFYTGSTAMYKINFAKLPCGIIYYRASR
ncbi:MAG: hypothetical protein IPJ39_17805 [Saprospiraceae bacterium]|nr:hypothetical protein [Saprospiraceae bacterium]